MIPETNEFGDEANRRLVGCKLDASSWSRTQLKSETPDDCDETMWRSWVECKRILCCAKRSNESLSKFAFEVSKQFHTVCIDFSMCSTMYVGG